jgi:hypothetical protein|tara:strand:- start:3010 stop:3237 length:228 start_codon:yes stop_codon:yes gene_type:complete
MSATTDALDALEITVAAAVVTVESAKTALDATEATIEAKIAAAVLVSENETIIPLANSVTNLITTQTLFINLLNK